MRVLHIIVGLEAGGAELMLKRLLERNSSGESMCEQSVLSLTGVGTVGLALQAGGIRVTSLGIHSLFGLPKAFVALAWHIRRVDPDIIQTWMYHADFLGGLAARLVGKSNVVWGVRCTDVESGSRATALLRRLSARLSYFVPKAIVCVANASVRSHARIGYDESKMTVIPNGFEVPKYDAVSVEREQLRTSLGFDPRHLVVGTVGRFHADKDYANFVRAAGHVAAIFPSVRFLMIGRQLSNENGQLRQWIEETGAADRFVLVGERNDVPRYLSAMDVFVLSSRSEGFPNVVGEAMSTRLPCVVTDVGDAAILVGADGVVVPKESPEALADGIMKLAHMSPEGRAEIGQALRERIELQFTLDRTSDHFSQLYSEIVKRSAG